MVLEVLLLGTQCRFGAGLVLQFDPSLSLGSLGSQNMAFFGDFGEGEFLFEELEIFASEVAGKRLHRFNI